LIHELLAAQLLLFRVPHISPVFSQVSLTICVKWPVYDLEPMGKEEPTCMKNWIAQLQPTGDGNASSVPRRWGEAGGDPGN
jgi:hypothetical protein